MTSHFYATVDAFIRLGRVVVFIYCSQLVRQWTLLVLLKVPSPWGEGQGEGLSSVIGASKDGTLPLINFVVIKFITFDLLLFFLFTH